MKLDFESLIERLSNGEFVTRENVYSKHLTRKLWIAEWHLPGCLSESQNICLTKKEAIESALFMAEGQNGYPRGMKKALTKNGRFDSNSPLYGRVINTVYKCAVSDLI